jgi:UDP-N-acetylmuramyl pentapeptide phosphotransferase/UDP-N-acetylglucosamine-1-phosphate transferase
MLPSFDIELFYVFLISATACALIILLQRFYMPLIERREDHGAVQAAHLLPTPRIGGLAVVVSLFPISTFLPESVGGWFVFLGISALPLVAAGLAEDLGYNVEPKWRLLAAALSSTVAILLLNQTLPRTGVPGVDYLMLFFPLAAVFTVFACTGISNAFNLIDGLNGLSSGVAIVCSLGMAAVAFEAGLTGVTEMNLMLTASLLGFFVFNYPLGKVFLGDAGAYLTGYLLAWSSVLLLISAPELTTWSVLLILFWPIADTLLAIYRRRSAGRSTSMPDRLHFHQLVLRALEIKKMGRSQRHIANPLATVVMVPLFTTPVLVGVYLWDRPFAAFVAFVVFAALFAGTYRVGLKYARNRRLQSVTTRIREYRENLPKQPTADSDTAVR